MCYEGGLYIDELEVVWNDDYDSANEVILWNEVDLALQLVKKEHQPCVKVLRGLDVKSRLDAKCLCLDTWRQDPQPTHENPRFGVFFAAVEQQCCSSHVGEVAQWGKVIARQHYHLQREIAVPQLPVVYP